MMTSILKRANIVGVVAILTILVGPFADAAASATRLAEPGSIDDADVDLAIERELLLARGVPASSIDVETSLGIATLRGEVDSLLAKARAERIASTVKGVRAVVNRIEVLPPVRSERDIQSDVEAALVRDRTTDSWEIGVDVERGTVTLTGKGRLVARAADCRNRDARRQRRCPDRQ